MKDNKTGFLDNLIAADGEPVMTDSARENLLRDLIDQERVFERKVSKVALFSWATTLACIVIVAVSSVMLRDGSDGAAHIARALILSCGAIGVIGLVIGLLTTITWLFRTRSPTLAVIEKRLAAMELALRDHLNKTRS